MKETIFTKIIRGDIPCEKMYEDDETFAFLDINPVNRGHTLVIHKKPYENIYTIPTDAWLSVMRTVHKLAPIIKSALDADGINLMMNNDDAAGQLVPHAHIHIIPRFKGDGFKHWPGHAYKDDEATGITKKILAML